MTPFAHGGLAQALRDVEGRHGQGAASAWRVVFRAIETQARIAVCGRHEDDVVQAVAVKISRTSAPFRGDRDAEAAAFLRRIVRHALIDRVRRDRAGPLGRVVRPRDDPEGDDRGTLVDRLVAPEADPLRTEHARHRLDEKLDRLRASVDEHVAALETTPARREMAWLQAEAAILAVIEEKGAREIAEALGEPHATPASLYKWTERGRAVVLAALDRWAAGIEAAVAAGATDAADAVEDDDEDHRVITALRELFLARRKDAGRPRPGRRTRTHRQKEKR